MAPTPAWRRILVQLRLGEAERILHERHFDGVGDDGDRRRAAHRKLELAVEDVALRVAVIPVSVGLKVRRVQHVVDDAVVARGLEGVALRVERSVLGGAVHPIARCRVLREDGDHAARGIAVQGRERPAQHLDPVGGSEIELRELALAVGHRARNSVGVQAHAPHAEARACAEAAHRHLQVLRVVLAAFGGHAGHRHQRLRQVHLQLAELDGGPVDAVDGGRQIGARLGCRVAVTTTGASSGGSSAPAGRHIAPDSRLRPAIAAHGFACISRCIPH